jgi:FkbM family methyltransferase
MVESAAHDYASEAYFEVAGVVIPDDPDIITPAIRHAMLRNEYEMAEAQQIPQIVRPGDQVLEIGAGIGYISTLLSRERRVMSVLAVEANPTLMEYMVRLHRRNRVRKVRRMNAVLTNEPVASKTMYLREDFWMGSLLAGPNPYFAKVEVPTVNLNALLRSEGVNLIVCDVEGAETMLFEDADLTGVDRVLLELHDHVTGLRSVGSLFAQMAAHGLIYDPRHSSGSVVLFRRVGAEDLFRPYAG